MLCVVLLPLWEEARRAKLTVAMERVSALGLAAVLLFAAGFYSAWLHVGEPTSLVTIRYGWTLVGKVGLVLIILGIAGVNRWVFLPRLTRSRGLRAFGRTLKVEAGLLLLVLEVMGLLSTLPLPR